LLEVVRDMNWSRLTGPSGTDTMISKLVAEKFGFLRFDTGAMYRSLTWFLLKNNIDLSDLAEIEKSLAIGFIFK
jgi:cytidylate kinase